MIFNINIDNRNFTTQPIQPAVMHVNKLTWSAFGGCDQAVITSRAPIDRLLEFSSLLRCPIMISDPYTVPVWWGFIDRIIVYFEKSHYVIDLQDLYNRVKVKYAFLSPDNRIADQSETSWTTHPLSMSEYGTREKILYRRDIDDDFALALQDTFLNLYSLPRSVLSPNANNEVPRVEIHCSGWFKTLDWMFYEILQGYYANHGPGPGMQAVGDGTVSAVAQVFEVTQSVDVKYVYFLLRKQGAPTSDISARIYSVSGGNPSVNLGSSSTVPGSSLSPFLYRWTRFSFSTPVTLTPTNYYCCYFNPNISDSSNHYLMRKDESMTGNTGWFAKRLITSTWSFLPSITMPGTFPSLYYRVVCVEDSGDTIQSIATSGNQFFSNIRSLTSGVLTSKYRFNGLSCLDELLNLMKLGTSNQRMILADVNPQRRLTFYEQPSADFPTVHMDRFGRFFTKEQQLIPSYRPPIGQYAIFSGVDRLVPPFDSKRSPAYFVDKAAYVPSSGRQGYPSK